MLVLAQVSSMKISRGAARVARRRRAGPARRRGASFFKAQAQPPQGHADRRLAAAVFAQPLVQLGDRRVRLLLDEPAQPFEVDLDHAGPAHRQPRRPVFLAADLLDPPGPGGADPERAGDLLGLLPPVVGRQHPVAKILHVRLWHRRLLRCRHTLPTAAGARNPNKRRTGATSGLGML
jgi:hypothetical protein